MPISRPFLPFLGIFQPPEIFENPPLFFHLTSNYFSPQTLDTIDIIDEIDIIDTIKTIDTIKSIDIIRCGISRGVYQEIGELLL